ncbi:MFS transporter [Microbacterium sediminis]|uniref:MFS transporter n=1 Tax=Microbacterium sediminis TaxID=904291 RepID=UPI001072AF5C|nr:MFS transporter [Microbacterium sediminis]QBR73021.1 MFS transporter [Microbacterium sediminis]
MTSVIEAAPAHTALARRRIGVLIASNLLGGVGVASSVAVGGLLAERLGGTAFAGFAQATSVLGAAVAAIPLASLAARGGRRAALTTGYAIALIGGLVIIASTLMQQFVVLLVGLAMFGVAQAVNLQSRYAAGDNADPAARGRIMSLVIWSTTIGSVLGPNLTNIANEVGFVLGLPELAGPYTFSIAAIAVAGLIIALLYGGEVVARPEPGDPVVATASVGAWAALRWAFANPTARMAVVLTACAHAVMVMVMVMTPIHMQHHGDSLTVVGIVISLHVLGMYAVSPLFGWVADRFGAVRSAAGGVAVLLAAVVLGLIAATAGGAWTPAALTVLGVGWSWCVISASTLLASTPDPRVRVPLQGVTDAGMNYAGAAAAALAGPILALGGFHAVNIAALVLLAPATALVVARLVRGGAPVAGG